MDRNENATSFYEYSFTLEENNTWMDICPSSELPFSHIYLPALFFLMFLAGVSGNIFVIWVMCSKRRSSRLVDTFVINLALADLVFVFTLPLWAMTAAQHHHWAFGKGMCKVSSYIIAVNRFSNIFFLTCMSVDRYLAVVHMLNSRYLRSSQCIQVTCGLVWASSFILATPSLIVRNTATLEEGTVCYEDEESMVFQVLAMATLLVTFVFPVAIIFFCYSAILVRLWHHNGVSSVHTETRRRHSVKMVFTIIAAFVVSWLPFNLFKVILIVSRLRETELSCEDQVFLARGLLLSSCLAFLNSCANPAIYLLLDQHFRRRVRILCHSYLSDRQGHVLPDLSPSSFSESNSWLSLPRIRSRPLGKSHT